LYRTDLQKKKLKKNEFFGKEDDVEEMRRKIDSFVFQEDRVDTMRKKNAAVQQSKKKKIIGDNGQEYEEKIIYKKGKRIVVRKRVGNTSPSLSKDNKEPRYLDRAALRRNGANAEMIAEEFEKIRGMSAEESRYVGGDISHTHWVKGLDYVLLDKIREEQGHEGNVVDDEEHMTVSIDAKGRMLADLVHNAWEKIKTNGSKRNIPFQSGRSTMIQPRDVIYCMKLGLNNSIDDIPEMIIGPSLSRPKDHPTRSNTFVGVSQGLSSAETAISIDIIEDLGSILEWHRKNRRKPIEEREMFRKGHTDPHHLYGITSGRRHPKLAAAEDNPSDSEDLDMFGDVL